MRGQAQLCLRGSIARRPGYGLCDPALPILPISGLMQTSRGLANSAPSPSKMGLMWNIFRRIFAFGLTMCLFPHPVKAIGLARPFSEYAHTEWGAREGLPSPVYSIAQTTDGFLWLDTGGGLYRFDGVSFELYVKGLPDNESRSSHPAIFASPNGDLWLGLWNGNIAVLKRDGSSFKDTDIDRKNGGTGVVFSFAQDQQGTMWAATSTGLLRRDGDRWRKIEKEWGFSGKYAQALLVDRQGTLWVATENTIVFLKPGARRFQPAGIPIGQVHQIAQAPDGRIWIAETTRSVRPLPIRGSMGPPDTTEIRVGASQLQFSRDGALWIATAGDGLRRAAASDKLDGKFGRFDNRLDMFTAKDGLTDNYVPSILEDREGNIWVGTKNGLDRFRASNVTTIFLPTVVPWAKIVAGENGDVWIANSSQVADIHGRVGKFDGRTHSPDLPRNHSPDRVLWTTWFHELVRVENGHLSSVPYPNISFFNSFDRERMLLSEDGAGTLWAALRRQGLASFNHGSWHRFQLPPLLTGKSQSGMFVDSRGRVWIAFRGGTLMMLNSGKIEQIFGPEKFSVGDIQAIKDSNGHFWIGGERGSVYFDGYRVVPIVPFDDPDFGRIWGIEEDSDRGLWLCRDQDVVHVKAEEWENAIHASSQRVRYERFNSLDRLLGNHYFMEIQASDGKLWFLSSNGLSWINPKAIVRNEMPPPVSLRFLQADGHSYFPGADLTLPARTQTLQIAYTALSLTMPERVRFRYKLDGFDNGWRDADTRREAFYTNLGPGRYVFHVIACNNDGVWNEQGAGLSFIIAPAWFQTIWFRLLCVLFSLLFAYALYRLRITQYMASMRSRFDERMEERARVARELHDTLMQTIQGSKLAADYALKHYEDATRVQSSLFRLSEWLDRAAQEGRAALESLRTTSSEEGDLLDSLRLAFAECNSMRNFHATFQQSGRIRELHQIVRGEVHRIGYEAIRNACVHSGGDRITVGLEYGPNLVLRVLDNGRGIDEDVSRLGKAGHFGILGMHERATQIGAKLSIHYASEGGAEVVLVVPGKIIFADAAGRNITRLSKWLGLIRVGR